jgi:hypothetical protein
MQLVAVIGQAGAILPRRPLGRSAQEGDRCQRTADEAGERPEEIAMIRRIAVARVGWQREQPVVVPRRANLAGRVETLRQLSLFLKSVGTAEVVEPKILPNIGDAIKAKN